MNYKKMLKKINKLRPKMAQMSDEELQAQVPIIRQMLADDVKESKIIIYAFALVREADKRIIGLFPNDEQILGAITIYYGDIAELKTGEGKTLVATMPLFLRALQTKGVFLITTNEYLAHRDYQSNAKLFQWLGLTVSDGIMASIKTEHVPLEKKKAVYNADIIYTSNSALGFDYLIDGLASNEHSQYMCELNYAILDEVDSILLDIAQTPLLISGAPTIQSNYFLICNSFVLTLEEDIDYKYDEERKNVWLTAKGIENAKDYFSIDNLLGLENFKLYQHIVLALKANFTLKKNRDYIIDDEEIKLLDYKNGRIMEGMNLQAGMQQAVEAKEEVEITMESQTISSITYQNLFRKFKMLSGMTGTAATNKNEFIETYNMTVKKIKTHKKNIRKDHKHQRFVTFNAKLAASLKKIIELHEVGRPVLVITGSVDISELYSMHLLNMGISHNVLNAKNNAKEAMIIKEAGKKGALTIATTMAGRGTDIGVDSEAIELGGLAVVLGELMLNKRVELQAQGRSARQGLPGDTYAYESLEDEVIKTNVQENIQKYYQRHINKQSPIHSLRIKRQFTKAQQKSEESSYSARFTSLQFDEILRLQKGFVDKSRDFILGITNESDIRRIIVNNAYDTIEKKFSNQAEISRKELKQFIFDNVDYNFKESMFKSDKTSYSTQEALSFLLGILDNNLESRKQELNNTQAFTEYLKITVLKAIDNSWSQQVDALDQLRIVVGQRSSAQRDPILEYEKEARQSYELYQQVCQNNILRNAALSMIEIIKGELIVTFP
ncbi:protein translocase subunit SecA [Companilactobacillus sp. RD055328]|uniref:preprotein translocase subunit SecA n=1 Tax=Companilactobacillus sp. RD055328 TaxID=2916634 RepID=UPI001FC7E3A3|nr:preprotein translocase subunit SecA [Companilactobacillus sp. RD055328]GKQ42759.1 protein translocase subunit SecA [Companilactobacillus sp. RD055328]